MQHKRISMIIPVHNGMNFINDFIQSSADLMKIIEVIFVDNGSSDRSFEYLKEQTKNYDKCKVLEFTKKKSSYAARNYGASKASGDLFVFTDIDCILTSDYVNEIYKMAIIDENKLVTGPVKIFLKSKNIYEIFDKSTYLLQDQYVKNSYAATANLIVPKKIFDTVGKFPEYTSGADNKFCKNCEEFGFEIDYCANLIVLHPPRDSYAEHIIKAKRLGIGHGERFLAQKKNFASFVLMFMKQVISMIMPVNSLRIYLRIKKNYQINFFNTLKIIYLCLAVNAHQRFEIIKTILGK